MSTEKKIDTNSLCYQIIEQVKGVRLKLGCCQTNFAKKKKKTGVAKSLIEKYERGIQNILPETLERMAKNLPNEIEDCFLESTNCVSSKDKKSLDLVQALKRIKDWKVRDAMCALTRFLSERIQIRKVTAEVRPVKYQVVQKARDWQFARRYTQMELADKSGMSEQQIGRYETGEVSFKRQETGDLQEGVHRWN